MQTQLFNEDKTQQTIHSPVLLPPSSSARRRIQAAVDASRERELLRLEEKYSSRTLVGKYEGKQQSNPRVDLEVCLDP